MDTNKTKALGLLTAWRDDAKSKVYREPDHSPMYKYCRAERDALTSLIERLEGNDFKIYLLACQELKEKATNTVIPDGNGLAYANYKANMLSVYHLLMTPDEPFVGFTPPYTLEEIQRRLRDARRAIMTPEIYEDPDKRYHAQNTIKLLKEYAGFYTFANPDYHPFYACE